MHSLWDNRGTLQGLVTQQIQKDSSQQSLWYKLVFTLPALLYSALTMLRRYLYRWQILPSRALPGMTISVGNISSGGTGKTPVTIAICRYLVQQGFKPAIVTRGYGSALKSHQWLVLEQGQITVSSDAIEGFHGDEAMLQSHTLPTVPVIVGRNRFEAVQAYLKQQPQVPSHFILDDGFQHLTIKRNLNLVLLSQESPFENGMLLPRGLLREPATALKDADIILVTGQNAEMAGIDHLVTYPYYPVTMEWVAPQLVHDQKPLDKQTKSVLITAIAKPQRVVQQLLQNGYKVDKQLFFKDHEPFYLELLQEKIADCDAIITTSKDFFRDRDQFLASDIPVYIVDVVAKLPKACTHKLNATFALGQ